MSNSFNVLVYAGKGENEAEAGVGSTGFIKSETGVGSASY